MKTESTWDTDKKREYNKAYRIANLERLTAQRKAWYAKNAERERARAKKHQAAVPKDIKRNRQRAYREKHRDSLRKYMRDRYAAKRSELIAKNRKRRAERPDVERDWYLRSEFGITLADYNAILKRQNGVCAICLCKCKKRLAVDHNHTNGQVRGLLCSKCNNAIGLFGDSTEVMQRAIRYIESFTTTSMVQHALSVYDRRQVAHKRYFDQACANLEAAVVAKRQADNDMFQGEASECDASKSAGTLT